MCVHSGTKVVFNSSCSVDKDFNGSFYAFVGRDSSVGIATLCGLDGPGIESQWGPPSLLYNGYRIFLGGKATGAWC